MVKQRHIQLLIIPGALLLLLLTMLTATGAIPSHRQFPIGPSVHSLPDEVYAIIKVDMPSEYNLDSNYHTRHWREALSDWHEFRIPESTLPGEYSLLAVIGAIGGSFIFYTIGWFQAASP